MWTILSFIVIAFFCFNTRACPDCSKLNRKPGAGAIPPTDCCGECKDGFEILRIRYSQPLYYQCRREVYVPTTTASETTMPQHSSEHAINKLPMWAIIVIIGLSASLVITVGLVYVFLRRKLKYSTFENYANKFKTSLGMPVANENRPDLKTEIPLLPTGQLEVSRPNHDQALRDHGV